MALIAYMTLPEGNISLLASVRITNGRKVCANHRHVESVFVYIFHMSQ